MEAVFLKILELSLYGSLLILAVLPMRVLLQKAPKWVTCLLWAMVAFALVCPLRFESPASVMPSETVISQIVPAAPPALPSVPSEPVTIPTLPTENGVHITPAQQPDYTAIGAGIWVCGMGLMLLYALVTVSRLRRRVAASLHIRDNVYLCDDIDTPFILGILRPRIYLPSAIDEPTAAQVLLHEGAHLRRRDHWWKPLGFALLTLHWFNPLVWIGYVLLCRDIELACDEKVVRDMAAADKKQYTEALLTCSVPRHLIAACPLAFGEVGVKQRIKAVLHYKKPAFWVIVIAIVVCIALCIGFLTKPKVTTLEELGVIGSVELHSILINSDNMYQDFTPENLTELLSQLELQSTLRQSPMNFKTYMTLYPNGDGTEYFLWFNEDCTRVYLGHSEVSRDGKETYHEGTATYKVLNPEILISADSTGLTTTHLDLTAQSPFRIDPADITQLHTNVISDQLRSFSDSESISTACALLNSLQLTGTAGRGSANGYTSMQLTLTDDSVIYVSFNTSFTKCCIEVYRMIDGIQMNTLRSNDYVIENPELLKNDIFISLITRTLPNSEPMPISQLLTAVEDSLNRGSVNWSAVTLPDSFLNAYELRCVVSYPYWVNRNGEIPVNTSMFFALTYSDDGFHLDYAEDGDIDSLILADTPFTITVSPTGSQETAKLSIRLDPNTGEILSIVSNPAEQPAAPTAKELQTAIEEHLRNKNRYFANLQILGDAFLDPNNDIYYLLITLDQTRSDGTVLSENNLLLVSVLNAGGYLRVDGMVSGTPAQSAGIYPNIAEMNGQTVLWTTRNVNHMKVTEDGTTVDANLSVPNDIYKCSIRCKNGTVHTWSLMEHGGVFLLPKGDIPVSVTPLDKESKELTALTFGEEYLDPTKVRTVSEESGWDVFLNIDSGDLCGYPTVQSFPLYLDMDSSFQGSEALYAAMKACGELPELSWSTVKLAGTISCEGYEYAAVSYAEGRDPMALLLEYQTNGDGTVTLLQYAKGYGPDEQGFLTGYYVNHSSMGCGAVYWSLFDTRYATSKNGKEVDSTKTTEPKFTAFRFTMRNLKTHDFPVEGDFFFAQFSPVIPPAIVTPIEGKTLLAALGSEPMGGLTGTITLND